MKQVGYTKMTFNYKDVIDKFGENPKCYLTGQQINIHETNSYHFDHITPRSKGGDNSINNLGICTKQANLVKSNLSVEELLEIAKKILENNGYEVIKSSD